MKHYKATGISLPDEFLKEIDKERGDISRSRYMLRRDECRKKDSLDRGFASLPSSESIGT